MRLRTLVYRSAALDLDVEDEAGIKKVVNYMAGQVPSLDDKAVCYGFYTCIGVYEPQPEKMQVPYSSYVGPLMKKLAAEYQARLIKWFEHALVNRANAGGGGVGIKKLEGGLAAFIEAIPRALAANAALDLTKFVPENEYLDPKKLGPLGNKILAVVKIAADEAGLLGRARHADFREATTGLSVVWDPKDKVWMIPPTPKTREIKDKLGRGGYGFTWNSQKYRWEIHTITPLIQKDFKTPEPTLIVDDWFWKQWYPKNYQRFTKSFSDYARNLQSSYRIIFSTNRKQLVKFKRSITNADDAIEELRYRYIGRQGREPWLKVMDEFLALQALPATSTDAVIRKIDLLNGMQHSNGLFMEHFPAKVESWYKGFLNAKFSAPDPEDLARYIPDNDLKELMLFLAGSGKARPLGKEYWSQEPGEWEHHEKKIEREGPDWREKGYPRYPGKKGTQPDRFDPQVQKGLLPHEIRERDPQLLELWRRHSG